MAAKASRLLNGSYTIPLVLIAVSFVALVGLRIFLQPMIDNQGAVPDEVIHFARSLQTARAVAQRLSLPPPVYAEDELNALSSAYTFTDTNFVNPYRLTDDYSQGIAVYLGQGLAQFLSPWNDIRSRLLLGRLISMALGVGLVWVIYALVFFITPDRPLGVTVAAATVLMPSVNSTFSALGTEGPAMLAMAFTLFMAIKVYLQGRTIGQWIGLGLSILACLTTKITAWIVLPIVLLLVLQRIGLRARTLFGVAGGVLLVLLIWLFFQLASTGAAHWYRQDTPYNERRAALARQVLTQTPFGKHALLVENENSQENYAEPIIQYLSTQTKNELQVERLTVGAWFKASADAEVILPEVILVYNNDRAETLSVHRVAATGEWQFAAYMVALDTSAPDIGVRISQTQAEVLWDGITLVVGAYDIQNAAPPTFDDETLATGEWGGKRFENLLRNASGEESWISFSRDNPLRSLGYEPNQRLFALQDWQRTSVGYIQGIRAVFTTFWGSFLGDVPGLARWHYLVIILGLFFSGLGWVRYLQDSAGRARMDGWSMTSEVAIFRSLLLLVVLYALVGIIRIDVSGDWTPTLFYATARFILPGMLPVVLLTMLGYTYLLSGNVLRASMAVLVLAVFLASTWMFLRVELPYYACPLLVRWDCTPL